jgi:DNA (cytosine-5)-methyltransferase 1
MNKYIHLELFAGGGGMLKGFELASFDSVWAIEFDKYACQTLRHNFPNLNVIEGDITQMTSDIVRFAKENNIPNSIDVISFGTPCQPFSNAGLKKRI